MNNFTPELTDTEKKGLRLFEEATQNMIHQEYKQAIEKLQEVESLFPDLLSVLNNKIYCYFYLCDWQNLKQSCLQAIQKGIMDAFIFNLAGIASDNLGDYNSAKEYFQKASDLDPNASHYKQNLKKLYTSYSSVHAANRYQRY